MRLPALFVLPVFAAASLCPSASAIGGCPCDLNNDNQVSVDDLLVVISSWGTPGGDCNNDGLTNVDDLILLLSEWGDCPGGGDDLDECSGAVEIFEGVTPIDTTTATVNPEDPAWSCAGGGGPDHWYHFVAPCTAIVELSTCNDADYDSAIQVFEYNGDCATMVEVGCNDDGPGCAGFSSLLEFVANEGQAYRIRIGGFSGAVGTGNLTITCGSEFFNLTCDQALEASLGESYIGDTTNAPIPELQDLCDGIIPTTGALWYSIEGDGTGYTVTTCNKGTEFDTILIVLCNACDDQYCVGANDEDPTCFVNFVGESTVNFCSEPGQTYLVAVTGNTEGNFELSVVSNGIPCDDPPICAFDCDAFSQFPNDCCDSATEILGGDTAFSTIDANTDGPAHTECQFDGQTYHDRWYTHVAECDGILRVSTCNSVDYDSDLAVYEGCGADECNSLTLLGCNDDAGGCAGFSSLLEVPVTEGSCYRIRIGGWNDGDMGTGDVSINCVTDFNFTCDTAVALNVGDSYIGSTSGADTPVIPDICDGIIPTAGGLWYTVEGDGTTLTASTCNAGTFFDTQLIVFCGNGCDDLFCVGGNDEDPVCFVNFVGESSINWCSAVGDTYYIVVTGNQAEGDFELSITSDGIPCDDPATCQFVCEDFSGYPNDCCDMASVINEGVTAYSTLNANTDGFAHTECQFDGQTYHDRWYDFTATCTGTLSVSTCSDANYDTDLVVYDGCGDCDNLILLGCNDDAAGCDGFTSMLDIPVVEGNCYRIRVGGWQEGDLGDGNLTISCSN